MLVNLETTVSMDWFQIGKGVHQGCILSFCLFNLYAEYIMLNAGWMKHKLESRLLGEISITSDMQMAPPLGRKWKGTKESLNEGKREEWKNWLKNQHSKNKIMASGPITAWQIDGETMETVKDLFSWAPKSLQMVTAARKLKYACFLEEKLW